MATGASDIFTQDLEDLPELLGSAVLGGETRSVSTREMPKPGLTPKREAWLFRAAQEANLPKEALERCLTHLRAAPLTTVRRFFDDLARRKDVFEPFVRMAA
jgi:hypothetical protein